MKILFYRDRTISNHNIILIKKHLQVIQITATYLNQILYTIQIIRINSRLRSLSLYMWNNRHLKSLQRYFTIKSILTTLRRVFSFYCYLAIYRAKFFCEVNLLYVAKLNAQIWPRLKVDFRKMKCKATNSCYIDETYIELYSKWVYYY